VAKKIDIPICATFHSLVMWPNFFQNLKSKILFKFFLNNITDKYIAISRKVKTMMINDFGITENQVKVIYNGVNLELLKRRSKNSKLTRDKLNIKTNDFVIINVAKVEFKTKNQQFLVKAFEKLNKKFDNIKLIFVGDGPDLNKLKKLCENHKEKIYILGERNDVPELLNISDVFVLPSFREGLPISVLESMTVGVPVIANNVGSILEIIDDKKDGFLLEDLNINQLNNTIIKLMSKGNFYRKISNNSMIKTNEFSINKFVKKHYNLYKKISRKN